MSIAKLLFRKWWVTSLQGILLIILSVYLYQHPIAVLTGFSFWLGAAVLVTGLLGSVSWVATDKSDRDGAASLVWSMLTAAVGLLMLMNVLATMKMVTLIFGAWMLLTSVQLGRSGWSLRHHTTLGWITLGAGLLSAAAAIMMMFDIGAGALGISTLFALAVMLTGITLVLLSVAKKALGSKLRATLEPLIARAAQ